MSSLLPFHTYQRVLLEQQRQNIPSMLLRAEMERSPEHPQFQGAIIEKLQGRSKKVFSLLSSYMGLRQIMRSKI